MSYQPTPVLDTTVGEKRAWSIDTEAVENLGMIVDVLERIQQQLSLITGVELRPGEKL